MQLTPCETRTINTSYGYLFNVTVTKFGCK